MDGMSAYPPGDDRPHAVVIGSGFGGLAAAVRLGAKGYRVTVFEALDGPGGRAYTFRQDGFTFDAGPTILTAPHLFEELWSLCGEDFRSAIDLHPLDPFYKIRFDDGTEFSACAGEDATRAEIARIDPGDLDGFERFQRASAGIFEAAYEKLAAEPFHELSALLAAMPDMVRHGGYRSVYGRVSDFFRNDKLRIAFSFHPLFVGGNPYTTSAYYCLISHLERIWGVHYAVGGTGALVRGLVDLIEGQGNSLRCNCAVDEILTRQGRVSGVRLATGESVDADIVVSNAEVGHTDSVLLRNAPVRGGGAGALRQSMSLFVWYFGTDRTYPEAGHHTILLGPRYKDLLGDIFRRKVLAEDFSLYLHRPTASDPSLAPPGCDAFYVLAPVPNLASGTDWEQMAPLYREKVAERLEAVMLPGLRQHIVSERLMTPVDFRDRLRSTDGAAFGPEPLLFQSAWFRPHNRHSDVDGLYRVGAGTHPGAGVPSVLCSAKAVDKLVPDAAQLQRMRSV
jgi:phytoene desaturase